MYSAFRFEVERGGSMHAGSNNFLRFGFKEIANDERSLINSRVPLLQVQKLCDVHYALFERQH